MEAIKIKTSGSTIGNWSAKEYGSWEQSVTVHAPSGPITREVRDGWAYENRDGYKTLEVRTYRNPRRSEHVHDILARYRTRVEVRTEAEALELLRSGEHNGWWWDYPMPGVQRVTKKLAAALEEQGYTVLWPASYAGRKTFEITRPDGTEVTR